MAEEEQKGPEEKILPLVDLLKRSILKPRENFIENFSVVGIPDAKQAVISKMLCESNLKALFMNVRMSLKPEELKNLKPLELHFLKQAYGKMDMIDMYRYFLYLEKALRRLGITKLERMVEEPEAAMA